MKRPSQRTLVMTVVISGLLAWSVLRTLELRERDRQIDQLRTQVTHAQSKADQWKETSQRSLEALSQQYEELLRLRAAVEGGAGDENSAP
jgi:hypothetical protein